MSTLRKKISIIALLIASLVIVAHSVVPHHHHDEHRQVAHATLHLQGGDGCSSGCDQTGQQIAQDCSMGDCAGLRPFVLRIGSDISGNHHALLCVLATELAYAICENTAPAKIAHPEDNAPQLVQARIVACLPHRGPPVCFRA